MAKSFRRQGLVRPRQGRVIAGVCAGLGRPLWAVAVDGPDPVHAGAAGDPGQPADRVPNPVGPHALRV